MAQTLKFGKGTWATKKGSTLSYNDQEGNYKPLPFTTTRSSLATRVNKEGLIEVVENDRPRIDYTDSSNGVLLLEKSATNLYSYSNKSSEWLKTNWTTTDNYAISPDGTQNAFRAVSLNNSAILYQTATGSSGVNTLSVYAKSNTSTNQKFRFFGNGNTLTSDDFTVTNEWKRIEFSYTYSSVTAGIKGASNELSDILFFGFQHEVNDFATSYIPTSGSAVTRVADTASGSGNSEVFNSEQGTLFVDLISSGGTTDGYISISDLTTNNRLAIRIGYNNSNQVSLFMVSNGGSSEFEEFYNVGSLGFRNFNKFALKYKVNDVSLFFNGFEVITISSAAMASGFKSLNFANATGGTQPFYGKTKEIGYYDTALTDLELEKLTSYVSLSEMATELNYKAL